MRTSPEMQKFIEEIGQQYGIDFTKGESHISIMNDGFMRLVIEGLGYNTISIAHYYEVNGDQVPDPDITIYVESDGYVPLSYQDAVHYRRYADLHPKLVIDDVKGQHDLAHFCDFWAGNLRSQGYANKASVKARSVTHKIEGATNESN